MSNYFYALQSRLCSPDRLYMILVTQDAVCGAYIAGQLHDEVTARAQLQSLYPYLSGRVEKLMARRAERERQYLSTDLRSDEFLSADRRNFRLTFNEVFDVSVKWKDWKNILWLKGGIGALTILDITGRRHKFVLTRNQDAEEICNSLRKIFPPTKFIGRRPQKITGESAGKLLPKWKAYAIYTILFLFFGTAFLARFVQNNDMTLLVVAVINFAMTVYCVVRAYRFRPKPDRI